MNPLGQAAECCYSEVADWQGTRRDGGSLFHRWGAAYRKERL